MMITECSLKPDMIENGVPMPFWRWKYEKLADLRASVRAQFAALHRAGYDRNRLHAALLAGQDVLGILPLSHSARNDWFYVMHEIADESEHSHSHLIKGLMAKAEAFRLSQRKDAPPAQPARVLHVAGEKFANRELDAMFLTHDEDEEDFYDLAA